MARKGGKREKKATLKYKKEIYTPEGAKSLTEKELRKEYSRLRSIARKRLERFENTEWKDSQSYLMNKGRYKALKDIKSDRELRHLFTEVARFVTAQTGSVSGLEEQRRNAIESLNDRGYSFVNKENFRQFADFMEYARIANLSRIYDSKRIAEFFFEATVKRKLSDRDLHNSFRKWQKKQKQLRKIQNINPRNSTRYRRDFD